MAVKGTNDSESRPTCPRGAPQKAERTRCMALCAAPSRLQPQLSTRRPAVDWTAPRGRGNGGMGPQNVVPFPHVLTFPARQRATRHQHRSVVTTTGRRHSPSCRLPRNGQAGARLWRRGASGCQHPCPRIGHQPLNSAGQCEHGEPTHRARAPRATTRRRVRGPDGRRVPCWCRLAEGSCSGARRF